MLISSMEDTGKLCKQKLAVYISIYIYNFEVVLIHPPKQSTPTEGNY